MPAFLFKIANPLMKALLNSPLHGRMSKDLMVLNWTGRKSGKRFSTPVGYLREGNRLYVFNNSGWWRNFTGAGAPVSLRLQGKTVRGHAQVLTDPAEVQRAVQRMASNPNDPRLGLIGAVGKNLDDLNDIRGMMETTRFIGITLDEDGR
jgi:hypothetical protein